MLTACQCWRPSICSVRFQSRFRTCELFTPCSQTLMLNVMTVGMNTKLRGHPKCCILILLFFLFQSYNIMGCKYAEDDILQNDELNENRFIQARFQLRGSNSLWLEDAPLRCMKHRIHLFLLRPTVLPQGTDPVPWTPLGTTCDCLLVNRTEPHLTTLQKKTGLNHLDHTWGGRHIKQYRINCPEIISSTKLFALIEFFILSPSALIQRNCFKWNVKSSSNSVVSIFCSGNYHLIIHVLWPTNILHYPSYLPCP